MDKALKQRLVGASVLIALAVVVLPMLLGGRPESGQQQAEPIAVPARSDGVAFETRRFPLADEGTIPQKHTETSQALQQTSTVGTALDVESPDDAEQLAAVHSDESSSNAVEPLEQTSGPQADDQDIEGLPPVTSVEVPVSEKVDLPVLVKAPEVSAKPQSSTGRYAVQVASLGSDANAKRLESELQAKGFQVISDKVESDVGRLIRIRVGPFDSESEAAAAVKKIQSQVDGVNPRMIDLDPDALTQDTNPSDPLVRWVVQLGSFGESSNAENLVTQVRAQGMSAYSEKVTSSSGTAINRVRVGPFLQREDAGKAQQSLKSSLSINGVVMSAD